MALTAGQINEAMGRAAMVYELLEVEERIRATAAAMTRLSEDVDVARTNRNPEELEERKALLEQRKVEFANLSKRQSSITDTLWGPGAEAGKPGWKEQLEQIDRRELGLVVLERLLRAHPEITPPSEDVEAWTLDRIVEWMIEVVERLPVDEREAWLA